MSMPQMERVFYTTYSAAREVLQNHKQPAYFMYDYSFDPELFKTQYSSATYESLARMPYWEWFIDSRGEPNLQHIFLPPHTSSPTGLVPPSTPTLRSPNSSPHPGVFGWLFRLSDPDMAALDHENALKGLTKLYQPVVICPPPSSSSSSSSSSSVPMQVPIYAKFYCDLKNTYDGMMDMREDPRVGRLCMMGVYRPFRSGCAGGVFEKGAEEVEGGGGVENAGGKDAGTERGCAEPASGAGAGTKMTTTNTTTPYSLSTTTFQRRYRAKSH